MWRVRLERALERVLGIVIDLNLIVQLTAGAVLVVLVDLFFLIRAREGWTMNPLWLMAAIPLGVTLLWAAAIIALTVVPATRRWRRGARHPR
ncbi:MAG TPA: hypothetical protein VE338_02075 [Ktedonobacterales bacterium]|jgi:hypothetical protein|nr:hypothetical protein [Ktedonobacterales bacterium]